MGQTLTVVILFIAGMACLPWLVRKIQQKHALGLREGSASVSRVLSSVAVGPQQRVVTVEVGPEHARSVLVLGVTAQQITCLHTIPMIRSSEVAGQGSFARQMEIAQSAKDTDA
jgi:flagellar protein FliO/FliZ